MSKRVLTDTAERILDSLPPFLHDPPDLQGPVLSLANEIDRLDAAVQKLIGPPEGRNSSSTAELFPLYSSSLLGEWEEVLGIPTDSRKTMVQRQTTVRTVLGTLKQPHSASVWKAAMDDVFGGASNWSFTVNGQTITLWTAFLDSLAAPSVVSSSVSAGGTLTASTTYKYAVTTGNLYGETTPTSFADVLTTGTNKQATLTFGTVVGQNYYIYRGIGAATKQRLAVAAIAGTGSNVAFVDTGYSNSGPFVPTTNTTSSALGLEALRVARVLTPAHIDIALGYANKGFILDVSKLDAGVL